MNTLQIEGLHSYEHMKVTPQWRSVWIRKTLTQEERCTTPKTLGRKGFVKKSDPDLPCPLGSWPLHPPGTSLRRQSDSESSTGNKQPQGMTGQASS